MGAPLLAIMAGPATTRGSTQNWLQQSQENNISKQLTAAQIAQARDGHQRRTVMNVDAGRGRLQRKEAVDVWQAVEMVQLQLADGSAE
jgi:hypothetical protein